MIVFGNGPYLWVGDGEGIVFGNGTYLGVGNCEVIAFGDGMYCVGNGIYVLVW